MGLGNPGLRYASTRHNIGFRFLDALIQEGESVSQNRLIKTSFPAECKELRWYEHKLLLVKPLTFMNSSGTAVREVVHKVPVEISTQLLLAYDDLSLPLGAVRLRKKGSAGGHKGMESVIKELGRSDFPRIRFGIGPKPPEKDAADFVLSRFARAEISVVDQMMEKSQKMMEAILNYGMELALSKYSE